MSPTGCTAAAVALVAGLALSACSNDGSDEAPTAPTTSTEATSTSEPGATTAAPPADSTETTTEPPQLSAAEQDQADIDATLQAYTVALDQAITGEESIEAIYPYSRDTAREQWVTQVMAYATQGITSSGRSELEVLEISVDGDTAEALTCVDLSDVEAVDANGDSFIAEDRLDETLNHFVLERDDSAEVGWYVVEDTNRNEPCDG